ncbi:transporter substrate-binding domain-containing protein [Pseudomonas sp. App30]|uniref:substrate-binding periplasmic protein n=1 Tax=Pseudomonas sp. App30 TaxID=3068990 RepID=UPI003A80EEBB
MSHFKRSLRCCAGLLVLLLPAIAVAARTVDLYLPEAPPLSMSGSAGQHGIVGEATLKAAAQAGLDLHLLVLPWPRAQHDVRQGINQLIIPLSRTPDRENDYTWIAPIMSMDRAFFSLDRRVETFAQARQAYARIAVGRGSAQEQKLRDEGFSDEQIYPLQIGENPAQLLLMGRVDAWFNGVPETRYIWRGVSDRPLQMSPPLMQSDLYLACSKRCDEAMVRSLRQAMDNLRSDGTLQRIADAYLKAGPQAAAGTAP